MIRKAILILLTVTAIGTCAAWAASYHGFSLSKTTYPIPDQHPLPARSIHVAGVVLFQGHLYVEISRLPAGAVSADLDRKIRAAFTPGWVLTTGEELDNGLMEMFYPKSWMPGISRPFPITLTVSTPLWLATMLLAAYPAATFVRGPLRRWRRRRNGSCVNCGYTLRGLTEPRCPECSTEFDPSTLPPQPS